MLCIRCQLFCSSLDMLTHKQLEIRGCILHSLHQAISIRSADEIFIVWDQFDIQILLY